MAFLARSAASLLKSSRTAPAVLSAARLYSSGTVLFQSAPGFRFEGLPLNAATMSRELRHKVCDADEAERLQANQVVAT